MPTTLAPILLKEGEGVGRKNGRGIEIEIEIGSGRSRVAKRDMIWIETEITREIETDFEIEVMASERGIESASARENIFTTIDRYDRLRAGGVRTGA